MIRLTGEVSTFIRLSGIGMFLRRLWNHNSLRMLTIPSSRSSVSLR
jgi:hypothetical protein